MADWIFYPPLKTMSGGCAVLLQVARHLQTMGRLGGILYWDVPPAGAPEDLPWIKAADAALRSGDRYIVPEGWPNALAFGLRAGCRCVVYCQNWSYLFDGLDSSVRWNSLPVEFWAVSDPVAWYMEQVLGQRPKIVRPAIDLTIFSAPEAKPTGPARIAFMPRKNRALVEQVRCIVQERRPDLALEWVSIHGLSRAQVAETLRSCHIFLATGFPEGCPLPPLEAMACGCLCVGFSGFGGWDYMRQFDADGFRPHGYSLRDVAWGGNGWWYGDGDVLGLALGVENALGGDEAGLAIENLRRTAEAYSSLAQRIEIGAACAE